MAATLKLADTGPLCTIRPSAIRMRIDGKVYRVDFWPDELWNLTPQEERPVAQRAETRDGWFSLTSSV